MHLRFQNRSREETVFDIKRKTKNEVPYTLDWMQNNASNHFEPPFKLFYRGAKFDGGYVESGSNELGNVDFLLETKSGVTPIEFKDNEDFEKFRCSTFKIHSLQNCIKQNAWILSPLGKDYLFISPKEQQSILDAIDRGDLYVRVYEGFAKGIPAVRMYEDGSNKLDLISTYTQKYERTL